MARKWLILAAVSLILCAATIISVRVQAVKASSPPPIQLTSIGVVGTDYSSHPSYHRGDSILLRADYYDSSGYQFWVTLHPAVYNSSYRLANFSTGVWTQAYVGFQENSWWITIPKNAPLGTYKYWFTLGESGYANQTLVISFKVVK